MSDPKKLTPEQEAAAKAEADRIAGEAKAKEEAEKARADAEAAAARAGLVKMFKNGVTLDVHESCVKSHESAGWKLVA